MKDTEAENKKKRKGRKRQENNDEERRVECSDISVMITKAKSCFAMSLKSVAAVFFSTGEKGQILVTKQPHSLTCSSSLLVLMPRLVKLFPQKIN